MKVEDKNTLSLHLEDKDAKNFKSLVDKIVTAEKQVGFRKIGLSDDELVLVKNIKDAI